jgi:DNA polymerase-3 subunit beta
MKASIDPIALKAALGACSNVIHRSTGIVSLKSVMLTIGGGVATFKATNLDQSVSYETAADGELSALLDTQMLQDRAGVMGKDMVSLSQADDMLTLGQGKTKWRVPVIQDDGQWPSQLFEELAGEKVTVGAPAFIEAIEGAAYAMEPNGTDRHAIQGVNLDAEGLAVALDGKRFSILPSPLKISATIPGQAVLTLRRLFKEAGEISVCKDERWIEFSSDGLVYRSRMVEQAFPEWRKLLPKDAGTKGTVNVEELSQALTRVSAFTQDKGKAPRVKISTVGKIMRLQGAAKAEENTDEIAWDGEEMELTLHPGFALEALASMPVEAVTMSYHPAQHHTVFTPLRGEGFRVVMAMRG